MEIKGIIFEDFVNYKKASMTIMMPKCSFKCDKECGSDVCQNSHLAHQDNIEIKDIKLFLEDYYLDNDITEAIVFQGLEPFDTFDDLCEFLLEFSVRSNDDIVIYTGYNEDEIEDKVHTLINIVRLGNDNTLIIKFGRFIPNDESIYDEVLGVTLASKNQYAKVVNIKEDTNECRY